jgi:hypothetical protein
MDDVFICTLVWRGSLGFSEVERPSRDYRPTMKDDVIIWTLVRRQHWFLGG